MQCTIDISTTRNLQKTMSRKPTGMCHNCPPLTNANSTAKIQIKNYTKEITPECSGEFLIEHNGRILKAV